MSTSTVKPTAQAYTNQTKLRFSQMPLNLFYLTEIYHLRLMARPVTQQVNPVQAATTPLILTAPYEMYFTLLFILIFKSKRDAGEMLLFLVSKLIQTTNAM